MAASVKLRGYLLTVKGDCIIALSLFLFLSEDVTLENAANGWLSAKAGRKKRLSLQQTPNLRAGKRIPIQHVPDSRAPPGV